MEEGKEGRDWEENDENDAAERPRLARHHDHDYYSSDDKVKESC